VRGHEKKGKTGKKGTGIGGFNAVRRKGMNKLCFKKISSFRDGRTGKQQKKPKTK